MKFQLPEDGLIHVVPLGDYPVTVKDTAGKSMRLVQVVDKEAVSKMAADFANRAKEPRFPGLLVDFDHFSLDEEKSSNAAAWLVNVQVRDDGLWAEARWTRSGEQAVEGGDYRLVSPVFDPETVDKLSNGRVRPTRLDGLALTNSPNMKGMVPITNRGAAATAENPNKKTSMDTIKTILLGLLSLQADATDEKIASEAAEAGKLINRGKEFPALQTKHDAILADLVEADLREFAAVIKPENKEKVRTQLLANRAGVRDILAGVPEVKQIEGKLAITAPLHNRGTAKQPAADAGAGEQPTVDVATASKIANRASVLMKEQGLPYQTAFQEATRELAPAAGK